MESTMSRHEIIRAWKDAEYRESLSRGQRAQLPEHPAGMIELSDDELNLAAGAGGEDSSMLYTCVITAICCRVQN
jgi:mersacidin/lichenicidin family type 2 lantibiotic